MKNNHISRDIYQSVRPSFKRFTLLCPSSIPHQRPRRDSCFLARRTRSRRPAPKPKPEDGDPGMGTPGCRAVAHRPPSMLSRRRGASPSAYQLPPWSQAQPLESGFQAEPPCHCQSQPGRSTEPTTTARPSAKHCAPW